MPLHDWSRVPAGLFHHFHQDWSIEIARALNRGRLPASYSALVEQRTGPREADILSIAGEGDAAEKSTGESGGDPEGASTGGVATRTRPTARFVLRSAGDLYAAKANRIVIRHRLGRVVAVIELVSPGNKSSRAALREFVAKTVEFLSRGVHVTVVDPFPPTPRDPCGIHKAIWDEFEDEPFALAAGKDRVLVSYEAGDERVAYIELAGVGDALPEMPLFLDGGRHVKIPLAATYQVAWEAAPHALRAAVESGG